MRITAFEASAVGNTIVKSPDVDVIVLPKSNTAIALLDTEELYSIAPRAEIVRFENRVRDEWRRRNKRSILK